MTEASAAIDQHRPLATTVNRQARPGPSREARLPVSERRARGRV